LRAKENAVGRCAAPAEQAYRAGPRDTPNEWRDRPGGARYCLSDGVCLVRHPVHLPGRSRTQFGKNAVHPQSHDGTLRDAADSGGDHREPRPGPGRPAV